MTPHHSWPKIQKVAYLGQELKRERELRGITLEEISEATKINLKFLKALEEDRLDLMPSKFFIKASLRAYAKSIGLEEHSVLNRYYESSSFQEQSQQVESPKESRRPVPKKRIIFMVFIVLAIVAVPALLWLYFFSPEKETPPQEKQKSAAVVQKRLNELSAPSPTEPPAEPVAEEKELILEISFLEETWLQVYADGVLKLEATKEPGETVILKAQGELLIHLGNAGGIAYTLNNKKGKPFGTSGTIIRNIKINQENYRSFLAQNDEDQKSL